MFIDGFGSGDLHDGNGLSDATKPNGKFSNPIFENVDYDVLTIGIPSRSLQIETLSV